MEWFNDLNWAAVMDQLNAFVVYLSLLLTSLGVPEEYQSLVAFSVLYLGVTVVVLLFALLLLKLFKKPRQPEKGGEQAEATTADITEVDTVATVEPEPAIELEVESEPEPTMSLAERFKRGLSMTQSSLVGRVDSLLRSRTAIDEDLIEELEEILITADLGMATTQQLIKSIETGRAKGDLASPEQVRLLLMEELKKILLFDSKPLDVTSAAPFVIMVVGVNGVGKTTTIGKLANQFALAGKKVILGAGDTFRAAAAEQLQIWGERANVEVISHADGADPGAVAFDAAKAAVARKADILLLDTAGRLHTKVNLMEELKKIRRVLDREIPGAPHEVLLVLDATTGQNALTQAKLFNQAIPLNGIALTKLDGTAKGGIVVAIAAEMQVPVRFVGIGEQLDDLRPFDAEMFVSVLFDKDQSAQ